MNEGNRPRVCFYGDDFTGATDTLATATEAGLRSLLFLRVPDRRQLEAAGEPRKEAILSVARRQGVARRDMYEAVVAHRPRRA